MPAVNPDILRWARETAGISVEIAIQKLGLKDTKKATALDKLRALEEGETQPSRSQLLKMAKAYRRPLLVFYLELPPAPSDHGQDFRTLPESDAPDEDALVEALLRSVLARQSLLRSAIMDEDDAKPLPFVGSASLRDSVEDVVESIRGTLSVTYEHIKEAKNVDDAFTVLRSRTEAAGVYVILVGNLGSHHTSIEHTRFRGFALADPIAPFVVINDDDHHAAWSFTLVHELAHIWLGKTGISGGPPTRAIEKFCNDIAAEFLLPASELSSLKLASRSNIRDLVQSIGDFARERNVSYSMVAYRLFREDTIGERVWRKLNDEFRSRWLQKRNARREKARARSGGPSYYVLRRNRLGQALLSLTARLVATGAMTTSKAGRVLGVKPKNVGRLVERYSQRAG